MFDPGNKLLRGAKIIGIVGLAAPGKPYHGTVMEIVVPDGVAFVSSVLCWPDKLSILWLLLGDKNRFSAAGLLAHHPPYGAQDVIVRMIAGEKFFPTPKRAGARLLRGGAMPGKAEAASLPWKTVLGVRRGRFGSLSWLQGCRVWQRVPKAMFERGLKIHRRHWRSHAKRGP